MVVPAADAPLSSSEVMGRDRDDGGEEMARDWEEAGLEARGPFWLGPEL